MCIRDRISYETARHLAWRTVRLTAALARKGLITWGDASKVCEILRPLLRVDPPVSHSVDCMFRLKVMAFSGFVEDLLYELEGQVPEDVKPLLSEIRETLVGELTSLLDRV